MTDYFSQYLATIRSDESQTIRRYIPPGSRILELGGGNGTQAALLHSWGHDVTSLDVALPDDGEQRFPVKLYDGVSLPFADAAFNVVFSSNTLEHVERLPELLGETKRVLEPTGRGVHVMPSATWRLWSTTAHYGYVFREAASLVGSRFSSNVTVSSRTLMHVERAERPEGLAYTLKRALFPGPHGEFRNAVVELDQYRKSRWREKFSKWGWRVMAAEPMGLFYTGYALVPGLSLDSRRTLARWLGSSGTLYSVEPLIRPC